MQICKFANRASECILYLTKKEMCLINMKHISCVFELPNG